MATIKLFYKQSSIPGHEATLYFRIIHARKSRLVNTGIKLFPDEWDARLATIAIPHYGHPRHSAVAVFNDKISQISDHLKRIISGFEAADRPYTVDNIADRFLSRKDLGFISYGLSVASDLIGSGNNGLASKYISSTRRLSAFLKTDDISFRNVTSQLAQSFENDLKKNGLCPNSRSFHMRNLRAIFNRAVEDDLTPQTHPFRHVYTGVAKTSKRALSIEIIKTIKDMPLDGEPYLAYARDIFMMSFYTRGMSIIDLAHLRKENLSNGILTYHRMKTGQKLIVKWEKEMQEIVSRYGDPYSPYLLPIINEGCKDTIKRYRSQASVINRNLRKIGKSMGLSIPLTLYVARHSWASAAYSNDIPLSVISEGMGHDSEKTTRIYLASLDTSSIDKANEKILNLL